MRLPVDIDNRPPQDRAELQLARYFPLALFGPEVGPMPFKGLGHLKATPKRQISLLRHRLGELVHGDQELSLQQLDRHGKCALDKVQDSLGAVVDDVSHAPTAGLLIRRAGNEGHGERHDACFGREIIPGGLQLPLEAGSLDDGEPGIDAAEVQRDGFPDTRLVYQDVEKGSESQRVDVLGRSNGSEDAIVCRIPILANLVCSSGRLATEWYALHDTGQRVETYLTHLPQGEPLSQPLFNLLHSTQLCWGFVARSVTPVTVGEAADAIGEAAIREAAGEVAGGDHAEDDDAAYMLGGGCTAIVQCRGYC